MDANVSPTVESFLQKSITMDAKSCGAEENSVGSAEFSAKIGDGGIGPGVGIGPGGIGIGPGAGIGIGG